MSRTRTLTRATTVAGLVLVTAVAASTADAAVRQSTYALTRIEQSSTVTAKLNAMTWNVSAQFRYTAPLGANRISFDYPTRLTFDAFTKGGTNPRYGVLQGVYPQRASQAGSVTSSTGTCPFPSSVPREESELQVRFFRTGATAKTVYVEVQGPNAVQRIEDERDDVRVECLQQMASLGTASPARPRGDQHEVSFPVPRATFRKAYAGRPKRLVLSGTTRTGLLANGNPAGQLVVRTKVTMQLVGSR